MSSSEFNSKSCGIIFDNGKKSTQFLNPGNLSKLHKKYQDIEPNYIEGLEFVVQRSQNPGRILFCNAKLSETTPTGLRIGLEICRTKNVDMLKTPSLTLDVNPYTLSTNMQFNYHIWPSLRMKWHAQVLPTNLIVQKSPVISFCSNNVFSLDFYRPSSTVSLNAYNVSKDSGQITVSGLKNVSAGWSIGSEMLVEWENKELSTNWALAARCTRNKSVIAGTVSITNGNLDLTYCRRINDSFQIGTSLVFNNRMKKAIGSICYQWYFNNGIIRAKLDSTGSVGFSYKRKIEFTDHCFGLSVLMNIPKNRLACGIKMDLNGF